MMRRSNIYDEYKEEIIRIYRDLRREGYYYNILISILEECISKDTGLILFRECLKNEIVPVVIEDANRNEYLEALKDYREEKGLSKLVKLFKREQLFCFEKCKYFM